MEKIRILQLELLRNYIIDPGIWFLTAHWRKIALLVSLKIEYFVRNSRIAMGLKILTAFTFIHYSYWHF